MRAAVAAVAAALAAAAPAQAAPGLLQGTVTRGPITPVCKAGTPCSGPATRIVLVFHRAGSTARTRTDARGRYRISLGAGTWQVSLTRTGVGTSIQPPAVRVAGGRARTVDFSIDTGIR